MSPRPSPIPIPPPWCFTGGRGAAYPYIAGCGAALYPYDGRGAGSGTAATGTPSWCTRRRGRRRRRWPYLVRFFQRTSKDGWISLGGVLLAMTGTEAMYADIGHFSADSIRVAFVGLIYPCLVLQYMGQAAFLSKFPDCNIHFVFFESIPRRLFWPVLVIATLASIVGSQAVISATFSIVRQCTALGCFPRVKIVHTSRRIHGQIYSSEINWLLMLV